MMRKKNITLNRKKMTGSESLSEGDQIELFLADETIEKFSKRQETAFRKEKLPSCRLSILYEDEDVLFINKPCGMLSQKASPQDISLVEYRLRIFWKKEPLLRKSSGGFGLLSATVWIVIQAALSQPARA